MKVQAKRSTGSGRVRTIGVALAVLAGVLGLLLWVWLGIARPVGTTGTSSANMQPASMTQTNEGGQVTIKVTWQGRSAGPVFNVAMDTHAVDLDGYDLRQLAGLRTDQGQEIQPTRWDAPTGGHHRSGTLSFPTALADGTPLIGANTRSLELVIRNVAGVSERTFRWTL